MTEQQFAIQNWTDGDLNVLLANIVRQVGEDGARRIQKGEAKVVLEKILKPLFDKHGRRISESLQTSICDANRKFRLDQPKLNEDVDFANRIMRLHECLDIDTGITAKHFKMETERLLVLIRENSQIVKILKGVWLPVILPQLMTDDLGTVLEQYLEAVGKSYAKTFSDRKFHNHRKGTLANKVNIVDESRHNQLIERMKQGPVIGIYFPNPLQGFSINADREQMSTLPEGFILSGMDILIAMAIYPDILARDYDTPGLDLAAFSWQSVVYSLFFEVDGDELGFGLTASLACACGFFSGGLLFLG